MCSVIAHTAGKICIMIIVITDDVDDNGDRSNGRENILLTRTRELRTFGRPSGRLERIFRRWFSTTEPRGFSSDIQVNFGFEIRPRNIHLAIETFLYYFG